MLEAPKAQTSRRRRKRTDEGANEAPKALYEGSSLRISIPSPPGDIANTKNR
jgi:hypothetical protein